MTGIYERGKLAGVSAALAVDQARGLVVNTFSGTWFLANLVIAIGCLVIGAGALAALAIEGRDIGWFRAGVFGGFAATGVVLCLLGAVVKVFLLRAEDQDNEHRLVLRAREQPVNSIHQEERYRPGSLSADAFRRPDDRKNGA